MNAIREHCKWILHRHAAVLRAALRGRDGPVATGKGEGGSEHVVFPPSAAEAEARRALVPTVPDKKAFTFALDARADKAGGGPKEKTKELMEGGAMTTLWLQAMANAATLKAEQAAAAAAAAAKKKKKAARAAAAHQQQH